MVEDFEERELARVQSSKFKVQLFSYARMSLLYIYDIIYCLRDLISWLFNITVNNTISTIKGLGIYHSFHLFNMSFKGTRAFSFSKDVLAFWVVIIWVVIIIWAEVIIITFWISIVTLIAVIIYMRARTMNNRCDVFLNRLSPQGRSTSFYVYRGQPYNYGNHLTNNFSIASLSLGCSVVHLLSSWFHALNMGFSDYCHRQRNPPPL